MIRQTLGRVKTASKAFTRIEFDALDLLRSDHMKVESLLLQLRVFRDRNRRAKIFPKLRTSLEKHMRIEESVFYPACAEMDKFKDFIDDCYKEHQEIRTFLKTLDSMNPSTQGYTRTVTELSRNLEKHIYEEEDYLFPNIRKFMDDRSFRRLNREMQEAHSGVMPIKTRRAA